MVACSGVNECTCNPAKNADGNCVNENKANPARLLIRFANELKCGFIKKDLQQVIVFIRTKKVFFALVFTTRKVVQ